jgi:hypothetical protein
MTSEVLGQLLIGAKKIRGACDNVLMSVEMAPTAFADEAAYTFINEKIQSWKAKAAKGQQIAAKIKGDDADDVRKKFERLLDHDIVAAELAVNTSWNTGPDMAKLAGRIAAVAERIYPEVNHKATPGLIRHVHRLLHKKKNPYSALDLWHALVASIQDPWYESMNLLTIFAQAHPKQGGGMSKSHLEELLAKQVILSDRVRSIMEELEPDVLKLVHQRQGRADGD